MVSLHIHERISTRAILDAVRRPELLQVSLFGETSLPADQQIEFYQHEVGWTNRLILGDSLLVMNSLLVKEGMAGKVQCVYIDPPYGIKYASNFQPRIDRRDVKDKDEDLTHEPEQIKAYRDTWKLGIRSYLTYLRDRLLLARELLAESGSIFVQISDENLHLVRCLMDEVFRRENFCGQIDFVTTTGQTAELLAAITGHLLWYAKSKGQVKFRQLFAPRDTASAVRATYVNVELPTGEVRRLATEEKGNIELLPGYAATVALDNLTSRSGSEATRGPVAFHGASYRPRSGGWKTNPDGFRRLASAERLFVRGDSLLYKRFISDFPFLGLHATWTDTQLGGFGRDLEKVYAVQTPSKVLERCIRMATDPGDLVLDPTCVRKGTRVWRVGGPPVVPPHAGGRAVSLPASGRAASRREEGWGGAELVEAWS